MLINTNECTASCFYANRGTHVHVKQLTACSHDNLLPVPMMCFFNCAFSSTSQIQHLYAEGDDEQPEGVEEACTVDLSKSVNKISINTIRGRSGRITAH